MVYMSDYLGYDPRLPFHVDLATEPGQYAIVQQAVQRIEHDGAYVGYTGFSFTVEAPTMQASNAAACSLCERLNNGMDTTELDDG